MSSLCRPYLKTIRIMVLATMVGLTTNLNADAQEAAAENAETAAVSAEVAPSAEVTAPAPSTEAATQAAEAAPVPHLAGTIDTGSTTWLLVSAALVCFMMPGLALFYGGMVRAKNVLNMFMCVMVCVPIITIQWVACGYSLTFAVPSAITVDGGKNEDGSDKPPLSYLGWDSSLVFLKGFSDVDPASPNYFGKIVTSGDTTGA